MANLLAKPNQTFHIPSGIYVADVNGNIVASGRAVRELIDAGCDTASGSYFSGIVPAASALPLTNGVALNVGSWAAGEGSWILDAEVWFSVTSGTPSIGQIAAAVTDVSATIPTDPASNRGLNLMEINQSRSAGAAVGFVLPVAPVFVSVPAGGTIVYYVVAYAGWTGTGAMSAYGRLSARGSA